MQPFTLLLLLQGLEARGGVAAQFSDQPDRLSLVRLPGAAFTPGGPQHQGWAFVDVFVRGMFGYKDYRWPHVVRIPGSESSSSSSSSSNHSSNPSSASSASTGGGSNDIVLALASACNATPTVHGSLVCADRLSCCLDSDEQMLMLRRSVDSGNTFGPLIYPWLQPAGAPADGRWPFPPNLKAGGQMVWDSMRRTVWLLFAAMQPHVPGNRSVLENRPLGLMLTSSTDFGLSFSTPFNLSSAIASQWGSPNALVPSGGNAALHLSDGALLFVAEVLGGVAGQPTKSGELYIHATGGATAEELVFNVSRSLLRTCRDPTTGKACAFDEAAAAVVSDGGSEHTEHGQHVFAIMRSDPALTHTFATAHSTDGGRSFGPVNFAANLTSIACQPTAVGVSGAPGAARRLFVAAPRLNDRRPLPIPVPPRPDGDLNRYRTYSSERGSLYLATHCPVIA